jgi:DNA integrity scanning protein DisA with diadenylate cyclase activity
MVRNAKLETYNFLFDLSKEIAGKKLGALFVIAPEKHFKKIYEPLYPQVNGKTSIFERGSKELILKLAELDGAFLIGEDGKIVCFGARIRKSKALPGYGTKHAAATGITGYIKDSTAILISEETNWIKVFKNGNIVLKTDHKKLPKNVMDKVVGFVTDHDTALLATAGASAALAGLVPVVIVSGTYLAIRTASGIIKKTLEAEN